MRRQEIVASVLRSHIYRTDGRSGVCCSCGAARPIGLLSHSEAWRRHVALVVVGLLFPGEE